MGRVIEIEWSESRAVAAHVAGDAGAAIVLAHGAGAGREHRFMVSVRDRLVGAGWAVVTFDYPYMTEGRKRPDRAETLLLCHQAVATWSADRFDRIVLGGKSMGGRMASHLVGEGRHRADAMVYLGYPLVALGKSEPRSTAHLEAIEAPQLFITGTRDRFAPLDLLQPLVARLPEASLHIVEEGGHSFEVPKRAGRTADEVMDEVVGAMASFLELAGLGQASGDT